MLKGIERRIRKKQEKVTQRYFNIDLTGGKKNVNGVRP